LRRSALLLVVAVAACGGQERVIVAAGTTLEDSGILSELVAAYEVSRAGEISVIGESTQRVLDLGRRGAAAVLITHAPEAEGGFVAEGFAESRQPFVASRFILVGPRDRVAVLSGMTPEEAFARIAAEEWTFVTRGDGSGTEAAERAIWGAAAIEPAGDWYDSTGLGMGATLQVADQRGALTLAEEGTLLGAEPVLTLVRASLAPSDLLENPYHVILVRGASDAARQFVVWLISAEGRDALRTANEEIFGEQVFEAP